MTDALTRCCEELIRMGEKLHAVTAERDEVIEALRRLEAERDSYKRGPVFEQIQRILDEESAWIAAPNKAVAERVAVAVCTAAFMASDRLKATEFDAEIERLHREVKRRDVAIDYYKSQIPAEN